MGGATGAPLCCGKHLLFRFRKEGGSSCPLPAEHPATWLCSYQYPAQVPGRRPAPWTHLLRSLASLPKPSIASFPGFLTRLQTFLLSLLSVTRALTDPNIYDSPSTQSSWLANVPPDTLVPGPPLGSAVEMQLVLWSLGHMSSMGSW